MKRQGMYEEPVMEVFMLKTEDVITASMTGTETGDNRDDIEWLE